MNYLWELYIKARQQRVNPDGITYLAAQEFSPYIELSFTDMNQSSIPSSAELNPFYRYHDIFCRMIDPNTDISDEVKAKLLDIVIHHLIDVDLNMGMCRREYQIQFTIRDLKDGRYGRYIKEILPVFCVDELKAIARGLLELAQTGEAVHVTKKVTGSIFTDAYIIASQEIDEFIFFLNTKWSKEKEEKINAVVYLFLPSVYCPDICWDKMYGIIGAQEFMQADDVLIY